MVSQLPPTAQSDSKSEIIYPDSDGKRMADNTEQFRWIVTIQQNLDWLFADRSDIFVAGDLLWYPVEGSREICTAPDVLVAFGRPKGKRGSYKQWQEDNIAPQVVFEILSPGNTLTEMNKKQVFYQRYGVEEYYLYDPDKNDLSGWLRVDEILDVIDPIDQWISPQLGIRFEVGEVLHIYRPDGKPFLSYVEIAQQAEQERQRAEQEHLRAEQERQRAEQEHLRAEQERQRAEQEHLRAERLAEHLRSVGINPDEIL